MRNPSFDFKHFKAEIKNFVSWWNSCGSYKTSFAIVIYIYIKQQFNFDGNNVLKESDNMIQVDSHRFVQAQTLRSGKLWWFLVYNHCGNNIQFSRMRM